MRHRTSLLLFFILTLAIAGYATRTALASEGIGQVSVTATPQSFTGRCPAHLKFTARIAVDRYPMTLNYQWERSDGAKGPVKVVKVPNANTHSVTTVDSWQIGAKGDHLDVWEKIRVRSGNTDITSDAATVTVTCR